MQQGAQDVTREARRPHALCTGRQGWLGKGSHRTHAGRAGHKGTLQNLGASYANDLTLDPKP